MSDWLQIVANIAQVVSALWVLFLGGKTVFDVVKNPSSSTPTGSTLIVKRTYIRFNRIVNIISIVIILILLASFIWTRTANENTLVINQELTCVSCDSGTSMPVKVVLQQVIFDQENKTTKLVFSFTNEKPASKVTIHFENLLLQKDDGSIPQDAIEDLSTRDWDLSYQSSISMTPHFPFIPDHGTRYTIHARIWANAYYSLNNLTLNFP